MDDSYLLSLSKDDFLRMKVVEALISTMEQIPYGKVTVTRLCKDADISRTTFYRLFESVDDVAFWEMTRSMERAAKQHPLNGSWRQTAIAQVEASLEVLLEKKGYYQHLYKEVPYNEYASPYLRIQRYFHASHSSLINAHKRSLDTESYDFEIEFFSCGSANAIFSWASEGMHGDPRQLAESIIACIPPRLADVLDRCIDCVTGK